MNETKFYSAEYIRGKPRKVYIFRTLYARDRHMKENYKKDIRLIPEELATEYIADKIPFMY